MGSKHDNWARIDLSGRSGGASIYLEVESNGVHKLPVSHFIAQYAVNQIPHAAIFVPLGRNARTGEASPVYAAINDLPAFAKATLRLEGNLGDFDTVGDASGNRRQFPPGPAVLFTGYVRGVLYRRVQGQLGLLINLSNRLLALTISAAGSSELIPGSPDDLFQPAVSRGTGASSLGYGAVTTAHLQSIQDSADDDFSGAVLRVVEKIAERSLVQLMDYSVFCGIGRAADPASSNKAVLEALRADGAWRGIANLAFTDRKYPLTLPAANYLVAQHLGARFSQALAATNIWGMLSYAVVSDFGMAIIPTATSAYLAPVLRAARTEGYTIYPDEFADENMTAGSLLPLFGVATTRMTPMGTFDTTQGGTRPCYGGTYTPQVGDQAAYPSGMLMFTRAPTWLDHWPYGEINGIKPADQITPMIVQPATDAIAGVQESVPELPDPGYDDLSTVLKKFSQTRYTENLLRGREGVVVNKLRFDIAPGTLLRVAGKSRSGGGLSEATDELATDLFGFVSHVTISINAQQANATTTLRLTDIRTAAERDRPGFSMTSHPFFSDAYFRHAPLVPELTP